MKKQKKIALYGAGGMCEWWLKNAKEYEVPVDIIIDANKSGELMGIPIIKSDVFFGKESNYQDYKYILTTIDYVYTIGRELIERGIHKDDIYAPDRQMIINGGGFHDFAYAQAYFTVLDMIINKQHYYNVYNKLQDVRSKKIFLAILRYRAFGTYDLDKDLYCRDASYFQNNFIRLGIDESLVDVGAYNGDSIIDFLIKTRHQYGKIYAIEGNENSCEKLKKKLYMEYEKGKLEVFHAGAGCKRETISYNGYRGGFGNEKLEIYAMDDLLKDKKVSLIKMDIEGMELDAIEGARKIITEQKPGLAICVYHLVRDIWEIQEKIMEMVPEYRFWLEQPVNVHMTETVLYASV
ncbi:MAG: FkbM family methyltransferase [Lachnospiraceae bacterium]|nr:FkbM family methyltransferase [Lachnospiraceae bacterium]